MAQGATLAVRGYTELLRGFKTLETDERRGLRAALRGVGAIVQRDAVQRFSPINARSAAGYKVRVRQRGVAVEQSIRKTTGAHPEWGSFQMRHALLPALMANEADFERELEHVLDQAADKFNRGGLV